MKFERNWFLYCDKDNEKKNFRTIVELKMNWNEQIEMENIDFLSWNDFTNHNYWVNFGLQDKIKFVHLNELDSGTL